MIKQRCGLVVGLLLFLLNGCGGTLLTTTRDTIRSPWDSFAGAKHAFDQIDVYETDMEGLQGLGFDPFSLANLEILTYLDIMARFMPNQAIKKEDLDPGILECLEARNGCLAYEIKVQVLNSERRGNVFLDLFGFKRKTNRSGWQFQALFVVHNDFVVYKLWGGKPHVNETSLKKKPLGPLQDSGDAVVGIAKTLW
jgi:hypothetical protein